MIKVFVKSSTTLEATGYMSGGDIQDIHDDLEIALSVLYNEYPRVAQQELQYVTR